MKMSPNDTLLMAGVIFLASLLLLAAMIDTLMQTRRTLNRINDARRALRQAERDASEFVTYVEGYSDPLEEQGTV